MGTILSRRLECASRANASNSGGRDGALRRPRRVSGATLDVNVTPLAFVPPAKRGRGHRSAMSLPQGRSLDLDASARPIAQANTSNSRGRDGALRRPRRVSGATLDVNVTPLAFVPPAKRGRGHRSAMSLPQGRSLDLDASARPIAQANTSNSRGRDGALRRPRRVSGATLDVNVTPLAFVPPAKRGRGHRSAMSLPQGRSLDLDASARPIAQANTSNSRGRDGALRRPRRVSGATLDVNVTPLAFVPPAKRGRGHRSAMSLPQGRSLDLDASARPIAQANTSNSRGRDGALRRPRRVSGATLDVNVTPLAFVPPAKRGRGHRSAMSLPQGARFKGFRCVCPECASISLLAVLAWTSSLGESKADPPSAGTTTNMMAESFSQAGAADQPQSWNWHVQNTDIVQGYPAFSAKYSGPNSLRPGGQVRETVSLDLYLGARLWHGAEAHVDGLMWQGFGLSKTLGVEAFPNGEGFRLGTSVPNVNFARLFLRQVIGLGGETEGTEDAPMSLAGKQDISRITLTLGKFSAKDIFDNNAYANDSRSQFMSWALMA